jgi:CO/xanthine dehydrogenase Mo-binding subunit
MEGVAKMAEEMSVIGKPENLDKQIVAAVTGRLDFAADRQPLGKLYGAVLASPHAHARIVSIDTSKAEALPGVEATCTYQDCPVLYETALFWGQTVAAVAATNPFLAERATQLIEIEYETRPAVIDPEEAQEPGSPIVGVWPEGNVTNKNNIIRGDVEAGFAEADVVIEDTIGPTAFYQHMRLEPESAVAMWLDDELYIWLHNRDPFGKRTETSWLLNHPEHKIHLFGHGCGGSHGSIANNNPQVIAAVLAKKAGKPVELHFSRRNDCLASAHQFAAKGTVKMGLKNDGTITACELHAWGDGGSNPGAFPRLLDATFSLTFICPNAHLVTDMVVTNRPPTATWRNVWEPPSHWINTIMIEKVAYQLGMNPLDFRLKNLVPPDMPHQDSGLPYSSNSVK